MGGRVPPLDPPLRLQVKSFREKNVFSQTYLIGVVRTGYKSKQLCQGIGCRIRYLPFFCTCRWNSIDEQLVWRVAERLKYI